MDVFPISRKYQISACTPPDSSLWCIQLADLSSKLEDQTVMRRKILAVMLLVFGSISVLVGGAFGQGGGFQQIQPVLVSEPLFAPSQQFPHGQHWIVTTKTHYAWALVGYNPLNPPTVDLTDPSRVIAFIDTGIDLHHVEFGGPPGSSVSKIHDESTSFFEDGSSGSPITCDCDTSLFDVSVPEDTGPNLLLAPHGSLVAGIGAAYVNQTGMAGSCWDCSVLVICVFAGIYDESCQLTSHRYLCSQTPDTIADAIKYAAGWDFVTQAWLPEPRARIISMSNEVPASVFSGLSCTGNPIAAAIMDAYDRGCIIVAIAGNYNGTCWEASDDEERCEPMSSFSGHAIESGIAMHPKTMAVGGACLSGEYWHCCSRINPLYDVACCPQVPGDINCTYPLPDGADPLTYRLPILSVVAPMAHHLLLRRSRELLH
ncbi:MAG: S8 family serine peptidase [Phycisphaeraceae bacterium]|nr:S8 family serine peptidase [Phycisphaeraceae bacterium]MCW5764041.1 S8 family serine peptidase [Phycisphaeraceae bacterium]